MMRRTPLSFIAIALLTGSCQQPPSPPIALVAMADSLEHQDLWPGFNPGSTPVAIFDGSRTLLFRHPAPPPAFTPLRSQDNVWVHPGRDSSVSANTSTELGGVTVATLMPMADSIPLLRQAGILVHELFHVFQRAHHPTWAANEADLFTYPVHDARQLSLRHLETMALRQALMTTTDSGARCWARTATRLRQERFALLPAGAAAYEHGTELNEGLATYVERRATGQPDSTILSPAGFSPTQVRQRAYRTGVAIGRLLDRFAPDWRDTLEQRDSLSLDAMLTTATSSADSSCAFSVAVRDSISELTGTEVQALAQQLASARKSFLEQLGWQLVVSAAHPLMPQGFDPLNVQVVAPGEVLHSRYVKVGNDAGSIEILGRPSLTRAAGAHPLFNGVRTLTVTGLKAPPSVASANGALTLSGDGLTATFRGATVDTAGQVIQVQVP
jgi:hypothetical protein